MYIVTASTVNLNLLCFYIFLTLFLGPTKTLQPTQLPNNDLLESDDNAENSEDEELGEMKSAHELRTLRLQKKIQQIETEAVKDKPWQMTGKIKSKFRYLITGLVESLLY